jgi:hypothetical protein
MSLTALGVPGGLGVLVFTGLVSAGATTGAAVAAGLAVGLVAFAVQVNAWGIQDGLRRTAGIPPAPGEARPRLVISLAELPVHDTMLLRTVNEPVVSVRNEGTVPATGCRLSVRVKCDELEFERTGAPVTVEPEESRDWALLTHILVERDQAVRAEYAALGIAGILAPLLGHTLQLHAWVNYQTESGRHRFSTQMLYATFIVEERESGSVVDFKPVRVTTHDRA